MKNSEHKIFCVISHTHWDREWYMPLELFRHRLVDLMDRLLDILHEHKEYIFHLDAQTVVLEDYLAVRPEKKEELRWYISRRRLMIGPFYLQNDFYLTSGESTVRNLLEGYKLCREFGGSAKVGYAADQFGNISQMPQILQNFGIDNFVFGRGFSQCEKLPDGRINVKKTPTEFIWRGADGSEVLAVHMRHWYNNAQRFSEDIERATRYLRSVVEPFEDEMTATPYILLMNGVDHLEAQENVCRVLDEIQKKLSENEYILQYNLDDYIDAVKGYISDNSIQLQQVTGEMRTDEGLTTLQGTLSSRIYLKRSNVMAQTMLENRIEPLYAMLESMGMKGIYPHDRLLYTWKNLLRNHPHDSICGCSTDAVHRHMENRFDEIFEFADEQLRRGMLIAARHTAVTRSGKDGDYVITVANTLAIPLKGAVEAELKMLASDSMEDFRILDSFGNEIEFNVISKQRRDTAVYSPVNLPGWLDVYDYTILIDAGEVEPFSFKSFLVTKCGVCPDVLCTQSSSPAVIENDLIALTVDSDGHVDVKERATGRVLKDCIRFEDREDNGDSYMFKPCGHPPVYSDSWEKKVSVTLNTPLKQTVRIDYTMELPLFYDENAGERSRQAARSSLSLELSLYRSRPYIELSYTLNNASCDHHLALCVDSDIEAEDSLSDTAFDVVRRSDDMHYHTTPIKIDPNASFAAMQRNGKGLAVFTEGQHEYMHPEEKRNRLSFALVRSTGGIVHGAKELWCTPENQCLRTLVGRMGICLFEGDVISADIPSMAMSFRAPLIAAATSVDSKKFAGGRPCVQDSDLAEYFYLDDPYSAVTLPDNRSVIGVEGKGIVLSAFKQSEDESGRILRFYNASDEESVASVRASGKIFGTRMDEISRVFLGLDEVSLKLRSKEIVTLFIKQ